MSKVQKAMVTCAVLVPVFGLSCGLFVELGLRALAVSCLALAALSAFAVWVLADVK